MCKVSSSWQKNLSILMCTLKLVCSNQRVMMHVIFSHIYRLFYGVTYCRLRNVFTAKLENRCVGHSRFKSLRPRANLCSTGQILWWHTPFFRKDSLGESLEDGTRCAFSGTWQVVVFWLVALRRKRMVMEQLFIAVSVKRNLSDRHCTTLDVTINRWTVQVFIWHP